MKREARLVRLGERVEELMDVHPSMDPLAAAAAVASLYSTGRTTPQDAIDYLEQLAEVARRVGQNVDAVDLMIRLGAVLGSSLHRFDLLWDFLAPERAGLRVGEKL